MHAKTCCSYSNNLRSLKFSKWRPARPPVISKRKKKTFLETFGKIMQKNATKRFS